MYYYLLKYRCSAGMLEVNELGPLVSVVTGGAEGLRFLLMSQLETPALIISHTGFIFFGGGGDPLNNARLGLFCAQLRPVPAASTPLRLNGTDPTRPARSPFTINRYAGSPYGAGQGHWSGWSPPLIKHFVCLYIPSAVKKYSLGKGWVSLESLRSNSGASSNICLFDEFISSHLLYD